MELSIIKMEFVGTYYYANIIQNILSDPEPFFVNLSNWHVDRSADIFLPPFPRESALHDLSRYLIDEVMREDCDDESIEILKADPSAELPVEQALKAHGFEFETFEEWMKENGHTFEELDEDHLMEYHNDLSLCGPLDDLLDKLADEVFQLLFQNRRLLANLNNYIACVVSRIESGTDGGRSRLAKDGVIRRVRFPAWVTRAVFFRDRGRCATCNRDLSGLVSMEADRNFDHVIPLACGGINDVTNIQLLCGKCNLKKADRKMLPSNTYEAWYRRV